MLVSHTAHTMIRWWARFFFSVRVFVPSCGWLHAYGCVVSDNGHANANRLPADHTPRAPTSVSPPLVLLLFRPSLLVVRVSGRVDLLDGDRSRGGSRLAMASQLMRGKETTTNKRGKHTNRKERKEKRPRNIIYISITLLAALFCFVCCIF